MCGTSSPRGGGEGLKNKFPNAPKLDTTHPYLLTAQKGALLTEEKIIGSQNFFYCGRRLRSSLTAWFDENRSTKKAKQRPVPPHSHTATHPYTAA